MFWDKRTPLFILMFALFLSVANAQKAEVPIEQETPLFSWAWEHPGTDKEKYPIAENFFWNPPEEFVTGGFSYLYFRSQNSNIDLETIGASILIRPIVLDFGNSNTLAIGFSASIGWDDGDLQAFGEDFEGASLNGEADISASAYGFALSFFFSSPEYGLQMYFDIGLGWRRDETDSSDLTADIPFIGSIPARGKINSRERDLNFFYSLNYYVDDRYFLYGFTIDVVGSVSAGGEKGQIELETESFNVNPVPPPIVLAKVETKINDPDDLIKDLERDSFVLAAFYLKAASIEVLPNMRITIEPAAGITHSRQSDGHGLIYGARIVFLSLLAAGFYQLEEQQNDQEDVFIAQVVTGFRFGRNITAGFFTQPGASNLDR